MRRMSHIWPGQFWPFSMEQEQAAVAQLRAMAGKPAGFDRDDVSAIMGILRCGAPWEQVLELTPGLNLPSLLGAYNALERGLRDSRGAWEAIVEQRDPASLVRHAQCAARLLPVPVHRALFAMEDAPASLPEAVAVLAHDVEECSRAARLIEAELGRFVAPSPAGMEMGSKLFSPTHPGAYAEPFYLADRVTALSPVRVAELLGEPLAG